MLPVKHRLTSRSEIKQTQRHGKKSVANYFIVKVASGNSSTVAKATVIISTKVAKKATLRNLLRRRIRGVLVKYQGDFNPGVSIIITVISSKLEELTPAQLEDKIVSCLRDAGALN